MLPQHDHRAREVEPAKVQAPVDEVARVVLDPDRARRHEERVLVVAQLEGIDGHAGEPVAGDAADVEPPVHAARDACLDPVAQRLLPAIGARRHESDAHDDGAEHDERAQAHEGNESAAREAPFGGRRGQKSGPMEKLSFR